MAQHGSHCLNTISFEGSIHSDLNGFGVTLGHRLGSLSSMIGIQGSFCSSQTGTGNMDQFPEALKIAEVVMRRSPDTFERDQGYEVTLLKLPSSATLSRGTK